MSLLKRLLGIRNCSLCGEKVASKWEKTSKDFWRFFSSERKVDFRVNLKVSIEVDGLCGKCFRKRADPAMEAVLDVFRDIPARKEELSQLCSK